MKRRLLYTTSMICIALSAWCQVKFDRITDTTNPIIRIAPQTFYNGVAWIDYDNDGLYDLHVIRGGLFHNDGAGKFTTKPATGLPNTGGVGVTWADVNNDDYIDCFIPGGGVIGSRLYINNKNGTFSQLTDTINLHPLQLKGWGAAFGDVNNDGLIDLAVASPLGFVTINDPSKFLLNKGDLKFQKITGFKFTDTTDAYTVPSWSDYDMDGDVDLFIGSGRVNGQLSADYNFKNNSSANNVELDRILEGPLGVDGKHDGQIYNWIDFDNDGDLDVYLTNYSGLVAANGYINELYRNDEGTLVAMNASEAGTIVSDTAFGLASNWGDFDNDGDLDCIVTNNTGFNYFYRNNFSTNGMKAPWFTKITDNIPFVQTSGFYFTVASADYDQDGDLDLFMSGGSPRRGLYKNKAEEVNKNRWTTIKLIGTVSNKSAIGAKLKLRSKINNGKPVWQLREISSQNTFNGMNMLDAHFGLGSAKKIDELIIEWPSGLKSEYKNLSINKAYTFTEGIQYPLNKGPYSFTQGIKSHPISAGLFPNPFTKSFTIQYELEQTTHQLQINIYDVTGKVLYSKKYQSQQKGKYYENIQIESLPAQTYFYTIRADDKFISKPIIKTK